MKGSSVEDENRWVFLGCATPSVFPETPQPSEAWVQTEQLMRHTDVRKPNAGKRTCETCLPMPLFLAAAR